MTLDLTTLPRNRKIAIIARALSAETTRRAAGEPPLNAGRIWARRYAGRPTAFIAELMPAWIGPDWLAWRSFVKTLFGEALNGEELAVYRRCCSLEDPPTSRQREAWLPVGRRGGKSRVLAFIATYLAACYDWEPYLAPGEVGYISVLADQRDHATSIMNYVKANFYGHPRLRQLVKRQLVESVEIEGRVEIEVVTASIKAVRSRTVIAALLDEIAFWQPDETCANPDVEIINALRPAMATIPNSMQLAASSRYARRGALWNAYERYYGKPNGPLVWSASTETMHPTIDRDFLAGEYERDPVAAAAEYGEEFRSDVAAFVTAEMVDMVIDSGVYARPPEHGRQYKAFVDPSGGSGADSMTMAIAHEEDGIGIIDNICEVRPPFSPDAVAKEFALIALGYGVTVLRGDRFGGEWPRERFAIHGVMYEVEELPKREIYGTFLPMVNSFRVKLLDHTRMRAQLLRLERHSRRGGRDVIDHPKGEHDDIINVVAGVSLMAAGDERLNVVARFLGA